MAVTALCTQDDVEFIWSIYGVAVRVDDRDASASAARANAMIEKATADVQYYLLQKYPVASILLREEANLTLAVGSKYYLYEQRYLWGDFAAAAVLSGLPITLVFLVAQKWIVSGLTAGGVKG